MDRMADRIHFKHNLTRSEVKSRAVVLKIEEVWEAMCKSSSLAGCNDVFRVLLLQGGGGNGLAAEANRPAIGWLVRKRKNAEILGEIS